MVRKLTSLGTALYVSSTPWQQLLPQTMKSSTPQQLVPQAAALMAAPHQQKLYAMLCPLWTWHQALLQLRLATSARTLSSALATGLNMMPHRGII